MSIFQKPQIQTVIPDVPPGHWAITFHASHVMTVVMGPSRYLKLVPYTILVVAEGEALQMLAMVKKHAPEQLPRIITLIRTGDT